MNTPRRKIPALIIVSVFITLLSGMLVQAKDYDAVCEKMWKNPFGMMAMKEYPVIVAPQEGENVSSTSSSIFNGKESVSVPLHTCTDPDQKHIYVELRSGNGISSPVTELQAFEANIGGSTHFGQGGQAYSGYHYEVIASYDRKTWSPARKFIVIPAPHSFPQSDDSGHTSGIDGQFNFLSPGQGDVFSSDHILPIRIAMPARLSTNLKMKISLLYGKNPGSQPHVVWKQTIEPVALYAGAVFETTKMIDFLMSSKEIKARESGYYQIQADLIPFSGTTPLKTTISKKFRITSGAPGAGALNIVTPDENHTYIDAIPIKIVLPTYTYESDAWKLILTWSIKPDKGLPGGWGLASMQVARQTFAYSQDNNDGMSIMGRTWTIGNAGVARFTASLPVKNLLAKAGISGGVVTLNARFTVQGKSNPDYEKSRLFSVHLPSQNTTNQTIDPDKVNYPIIVKPKEHQKFLEGQQIWIQVKRKDNQEITLMFYKNGKFVPVERMSLNTNPGIVSTSYMLDKGKWVVIANYSNNSSHVSSPRAFEVGTIHAALMQNLKHDKSATEGMLPTAPVILSPQDKEVFQEGEPIILKLQHSPVAKYFSFELEKRKLYSKNAFKNVEKWFGTFYIKDDLVRYLKPYGIGDYRVRVGTSLIDNDWDNSVLSPWLSYKVIKKDQQISQISLQQKWFIPGQKSILGVPLIAPGSSQKASLNTPDLDLKPEFVGKQGAIPSSLKVTPPGKDIQAAKSEKGKLSGRTEKNSINPQPEPPGKQIKYASMPLVIMPHPRTYRQSEKVKIAVKNTPFNRIPFELRYRAAVGKPYRIIKKSDHTFIRTNGITTLNFSLKNPGEYQVRFRANHKTPWTQWSPFKILTNPSHAAALAQTMRVMPTASRAINPQPEPPGKSSRVRSITASKRTAATKVQQPKRVRQIQLTAPKVRTPRNGQKYMLAGNAIHIKAAIIHDSGQQIQVEVEVKNGGRFIPIKTRISKHQMKTKTDVDILIANTGGYRLRVRPQRKNGRWTNWTNFSVDTLVKHRPQLGLQQPAHTKMRPVIKKTQPTVQRIR